MAQVRNKRCLLLIHVCDLVFGGLNLLQHLSHNNSFAKRTNGTQTLSDCAACRASIHRMNATSMTTPAVIPTIALCSKTHVNKLHGKRARGAPNQMCGVRTSLSTAGSCTHSRPQPSTERGMGCTTTMSRSVLATAPRAMCGSGTWCASRRPSASTIDEIKLSSRQIA